MSDLHPRQLVDVGLKFGRRKDFCGGHGGEDLAENGVKCNELVSICASVTEIERSKSTQSYSTSISDRSNERLKFFIEWANKSMPHPLDMGRFHKFVRSVHDDGVARSDFNEYTLSTILKDEGFSEDMASDFGTWFEFGIDVLNTPLD
jgi:hypothetical protein